MKRGLIIVAVTGVIQLIWIAIILAVVARTTEYDIVTRIITNEKDNGVCLTPGCIDTASRISSYINPKIEPCDDFYMFACGGYQNTTVIPDDKLVVHVAVDIADKLRRQLKTSLEESSTPNEPRAFRLAKTLYKSCMNNTAIKSAGLASILDILQQLGKWPVLEGDNWKEDAFSWTETIHKLQKLGYSGDYFISMSISPDARNTTKRVISLDQAPLGISRAYLSRGSGNPIMKAYSDYMVDIAVILGADKHRATRELEKSLEFEIKLANITLPNAKRRNFSLLYNPMTVAELNKRYTSVNWTEYLNNLLSSSVRVDDSEIVIVSAPSYISRLENLLETTTKRVQANYIMWRTVLSSINFLTEEIKNRQLEFDTILLGRTERRARWKECYSIVSARLSLSIDALYVRRFFDQKTKITAAELINEIKKEFTHILEQTEWMDNTTRLEALKKIASMYSKVAYSAELLDDNKLDEYYASLELRTDDLLGNIQNLTLFRTKYEVERLRKPVNKADWTTSESAAINAHYDLRGNGIDISAGILQGVFFGRDRPQYMNYGSGAIIIGHEMTHGFDDIGSQFDQDGNWVNWWKPETKEKFLEKAECIIHQYGNYTDETVGLKLNGIKTQGENIADNGCMKLGYRAYTEWVKRNGPEPKLPGLDFTPKQLFWIAAAQTFCSKHRPETLELLIATDSHSPPEFRVRGSLSNQPEFATDFNCPVGSNMNPEQKCSVW